LGKEDLESEVIMKEEHINYPTLWKPVMLKGVPRDYLMFLILLFGFANLASVFFSFGSVFWGIGVFGIGFFYGILRARSDPEFFTVYLVKFFRIRKTKGGHKGNRYHA
jgi:type IV secretory pathway TrbD component